MDSYKNSCVERAKISIKADMEYINYRPTWAEIDISAIEFNFNQIRKVVGKNTMVMAVVKCEAYGHGLLPIAKKLSGIGVDYFGVASIDEAIVLRENSISVPILVLGNILNKDIEPVLKYDLTQTVSDYSLAARLNEFAIQSGKVVKIHIKVDTGMGRLGVLHQEAVDFIKKVINLSHLNIEGLFTHLSCADSDSIFTQHQIDIFNQIVSSLEKAEISVPFLHVANSMGVISYPESHFNLVRPGLMMYGVFPGCRCNSGQNINLKQVLSLKTQVIYKKRLPAGHGISYGRNYITKSETNIVVLPIGYGDGYPRNLSGRADVLIKGERFRISGTVCMDQIMIDVGMLDVNVGDEVVLIGSQEGRLITVEEIAHISGTIPYEILCGIGSRVPRVYIS